jgi:hypothetical protein
MPKEEFINKILQLEKYLALDIVDTLESIYSNLCQRNANGQGEPSFFIHLAPTIFYEVREKLLIRDKDHGKKGAPIFNKTSNLLDKISKVLQKNLPPDIRRIVEYYQAEFMVHQTTVHSAMSTLDADKKAHLSEFQNFDPNRGLTPLTPTKKALVRAMHPTPPKGTPKKLRDHDRTSLAALQRVKRQLLAGKKEIEEEKPAVVLNVRPTDLVPASVLRRKASFNARLEAEALTDAKKQKTTEATPPTAERPVLQPK